MVDKTFKEYLITTIKEGMKFAIISTIILVVITIIFGYLFIDRLKMDMTLSAVIISILSTITIVYVEETKIHSWRKILDNNREMTKQFMKK